jgi:hypothetical protein
MRATTLRSATAAAAVPAALVVVLHLAWSWHEHTSSAERQSIAFSHGVALAAILGLALIAARVALALERRSDHPLADALAVAGAIAVLSHLAAVWKDEGGIDSRSAALEHVAALAVVALATTLVRRLERARR